MVNLNTATAEELEALPHIGPVIAGRIVRLRRERDRFQRVDELREVLGIGAWRMERLLPLVRV